MNRILGVLIGFLVSLICFFCAALIIIGPPTLLRNAAKARPYATVFLPLREDSRSQPTEPAAPIIIFMGDSSVVQPPWAETGSPSIPSLLQAELRGSSPGFAGATVAEWAFPGGRLFHYYCLLFEAEKHSPALVVIPINWRSIGPQSAKWSESFAFPELSALVPLGERGNASGAFIMQMECISPSRQRFYRVRRPLLYVSGLRIWLQSAAGMRTETAPPAELLDLLPAGKRLIARYSDKRLFTQYANDIPADDPQLRALRSIVEAAGRRNLNLLFYVTPIHLDEMRNREVFDDGSFRESLGRILTAARSEAAVCLDLSALLREDDFIDNYEHYTAEGNRQIAAALAEKAGEILKAVEGPAAASGGRGAPQTPP